MNTNEAVSKSLGLLDATLGSVRNYTAEDLARRLALVAAILRDNQEEQERLGQIDLERQNTLDKTEVEEDDSLELALDELFTDAMIGDPMQEFAHNHPGKEIEIFAEVTVQVVDNPGCSIVGRYDGFILKSDDVVVVGN